MSIGGTIRRNIYWLNDYIHGSKVRKHFDELNRFKQRNAQTLARQKELCENVLSFAVKNCAFYKNVSCVNLKSFPVVNKQILNDNRTFIAIDVNEIPEQETEQVHIQRTSGSTGTPFAIPQDSRKRHRRVAELKFFGEDVGFKSHEKLGQCRIWTKWQSKGKWQSFKENIIPINVANMDEDTLSNICQIAKKERLVSMRAYASWYDKLVEYLESGKADPNDFRTVKVFISSSEALNEETRVKMKRIAGIPIVECYANEENGVLAQQKLDDNNYYLNNASYIFEILKMDSDEPAEYGELGRIVITDLYNYAFPMIRYDTGDTGILEKGNSVSGGWDYMSKLYGRRLDLIYNAEGNPIHPMNFARVLKNFSGIKQWQFVQKDEKKYLLKLNAKRDIDQDKIIQEILNIVGEGSVNIEFVSDIPVMSSGKRKPVVCEWRKNG